MALIKKFKIEKFNGDETIVEIKNASVFYNKRQILNNLNLDINRQEILGMLGPNGVGKSTIFQIITGLKDPSFGKVSRVDCCQTKSCFLHQREVRYQTQSDPIHGVVLGWELVRRRPTCLCAFHSIGGRKSV